MISDLTQTVPGEYTRRREHGRIQLGWIGQETSHSWTHYHAQRLRTCNECPIPVTSQTREGGIE